MEVKSEKENKTYVKHHSFETFASSVGSDPEAQRRRVLTMLDRCSKEAFDRQTVKIIEAVIADLSSQLETAEFRITVLISDELSRIDDDQVVNYIVNRYRYDVYPQKKILDQFPPYLQIEPTSICNFRCVFCYQTDLAFTDKKSGHMGSMSLEMFKLIIDQIQGNIEFISLASRGEPMACRGIDDMLKYCVGKFLGLKVNTNASLLTEEHCHAILAGGVNSLVFSADAADETMYSKLRVGGNLKKILSNVEMFKEIKEKHYPRSRILTRVSGVKVNTDQNMEDMVKLWGGLVDQVSFVKYNPWENVYEAPHSSVNVACSDLWRRMFIWHNGVVNPCDTDYKSVLTTGNIQGTTIDKIWRSEAYENLRTAHVRGRRCRKNPCQRCTVV